MRRGAKVEFNITLFPKQSQALKILYNNTTREVLYGGAAGGAKTFLGCCWQIAERIRIPESRGVIARARAKHLLSTTLQTFYQVAGLMGFEAGKHFRFKPDRGVIEFVNGSTIYLKEIAWLPSDPDYARLGSLEITDAFIDEAAEVTEKAALILASRIRYKIKESGRCAKLLLTANPSRNWLFRRYYEPWKLHLLPPERAFIQALLKDNLKADFATQYAEQLKHLDDVSKQRLLHGQWEFDSNALSLFPASVFERLAIRDSNIGPYFISADIARFGSDATVIVLWQNLHIQSIIYLQKKSLAESVDEIRALQRKYHIPASSIIIDADGIGSGVTDQLPGSIGFHANQKPFPVPSQGLSAFQNMKVQCYFKLHELMEEGRLSISPQIASTIINGSTIRDLLSNELEAIHRASEVFETKIAINSKDEQKRLLGKSPDFADALMLRMYFELKPRIFSFN